MNATLKSLVAYFNEGSQRAMDDEFQIINERVRYIRQKYNVPSDIKIHAICQICEMKTRSIITTMRIANDHITSSIWFNQKNKLYWSIEFDVCESRAIKDIIISFDDCDLLYYADQYNNILEQHIDAKRIIDAYLVMHMQL